MRSAGLTHGWYCVHFKSRDAMLLETLAIVLRDARRKYRAVGAAMRPREALAHVIEDYISPAHRDGRSSCPIVTLSSDVPRQPPKFRAALPSRSSGDHSHPG
jgi:TetR/AcrR family transcriptional repressor of nem operon